MTHTHTWQVDAYVLLSLPRQGMADRVIRYRCTGCPLVQTLEGELRLGVPLNPPDWLEAQATVLTTRASREAKALLRAQRHHER
jgi:hypothetical protein